MTSEMSGPRAAAILGAFTGIACGPFADIHKYAEDTLGRPVWTHEFASKELWAELREKAKPDFVLACEWLQTLNGSADEDQ